MDVLNALAPVFFIVALGAFLRHSGFMPAVMAGLVNRLTYWVALPALLFLETSDTHIGLLRRTDIFLVLIGGAVAAMAAGYAASLRKRRVPWCRRLSGAISPTSVYRSSPIPSVKETEASCQTFSARTSIIG